MVPGIDPNLFHLDWERVFEVLCTIVVLAILLERAMSLVFEHRWFVKYLNDKGIKEIIMFAISFIVCLIWQFDIISIILVSDKTTFIGVIISALIIAGGSKGSVKLFRDIMQIKSTAYKEMETQKSMNVAAEKK
jgi:hypothetical protein